VQTATATIYKLALLLSIIDICMERPADDDSLSFAIGVHELAEHVTGQYWAHTDPFPGSSSGGILRQSGTGQAEIVSLIQRFRDQNAGSRPLFGTSELTSPVTKLVADVAWKLAEMPLPRLQRIGGSVVPVLYDVGWDESISRRDFQASGFDRSITLHPGVAGQLVRLASLLRPLIERHWASRVTVYNRLSEGELEHFLFRRTRLDALQMRGPLLELQGHTCFYTGASLDPRHADVDHFIPWSRSPNNAIENLVVADRKVNNNKSNHLAAVQHIEKWTTRNTQQAHTLANIAAAQHWLSNPEPTLGVARSIYLGLPPARNSGLALSSSRQPTCIASQNFSRASPHTRDRPLVS
jgi:5-methylcytosine-specific restriction endonuclease McrA